MSIIFFFFYWLSLTCDYPSNKCSEFETKNRKTGLIEFDQLWEIVLIQQNLSCRAIGLMFLETWSFAIPTIFLFELQLHGGRPSHSLWILHNLKMITKWVAPLGPPWIEVNVQKIIYAKLKKPSVFYTGLNKISLFYLRGIEGL